MSLDVYLTMDNMPQTGDIEKIFIRENGANREISREEWDERFPGTRPTACLVSGTNRVFEANITHNLGKMANEAGCYEPLWRPDEIGITHARQLIEPLTKGLATLGSNPERFKKFNPLNGWGDFEGLVDFIASYLAACVKYPNAAVSVWR